MALDDIFNEQELNFDRLKEEERRLKKMVFLIAFLGISLWIYIAYLATGFDIELFTGFVITLVFSPLISGLILTTFIAMFPYRGFNYQQRFLRYFLMVLMLQHILIVALAILDLATGGIFSTLPPMTWVLL